MEKERRVPVIAVISALRGEVSRNVHVNAMPESDPPARIIYSCCGVGLRRAQVHTAALCRAYRPRAIYFVGSAGAISDSLAPHTVAIPHRVMYIAGEQTDTTLRAVETSDDDIERVIDMLGAHVPVTRQPLLTVNTPVISDDDRHYLHQSYSADTVDMESYAVASVATQHRIPVTIVKYVTDRTVHDLRNFHYHIAQCAVVLDRVLPALLKNRTRIS